MSELFIKRDGKISGPHTREQVEKAIKAGMFRDSDRIARSKDGPWSRLPSHNSIDQASDSATPTETDKSSEQQHTPEDLYFSEESYDYDDVEDVDSLAFDEIEVTDEPLPSRSYKPNPLTPPHPTASKSSSADHRRSNRDGLGRRRPRTASDTSTGELSCPQPGVIVESLFAAILQHDNPSDAEYTATERSNLSFGFLMLGVLGLLIGGILLVKTARFAGIDNGIVLSSLFGLLVYQIGLILMHFVCDNLLAVRKSLLQNPIVEVSSIRHLYILASCIAGVVLTLMTGCLTLLVGAFGRQMSSQVLPSYDVSIAVPICGVILIVAVMCLIGRAILSPESLGVVVMETATPGQTGIGLTTMLYRLPIYGLKASIGTGVIAGILCSFSVLILMLPNESGSLWFFGLITTILAPLYIVALFVGPISAYLIYISSMIVLEVLQMCRSLLNIAASK